MVVNLTVSALRGCRCCRLCDCSCSCFASLALVRWMVKYPLSTRDSGKAAAGIKQKRFFVLAGQKLSYYNQMCNSQGQCVPLRLPISL